MEIAKIIKYEGDNSTFVWKHPSEDFNSLTQLIVHESQEAVFMLNGQILDVFGAGRYTLETQKVPKLGKILNRTTDDKTPFHCEVYFVNKAEQMAIRWGTDSKVMFMEPTYNFPISIGASGEMSLRADDSKRLLLKIVGTTNVLSQATLTQYFRAFLMTRIKSYLARVMREEKISIFQIDEHLVELSTILKEMLVTDFIDYGVALERFFVTNIVRPEGERNYEQFKALYFRQYADIAEAKLRQQTEIIGAETAAHVTVIESQAVAQKRTQEGYTYHQEKGFEVAEKAAANPSSGQFTGLGIGLATMAGIGSAVGDMVGSAMNETATKTIKCPKCGADLLKNSKFCNNCGEKIAADVNIICPACGKAVPKTKFCPECGNVLETKCPNCGKETHGAKYCPDCGTKL